MRIFILCIAMLAIAVPLRAQGSDNVLQCMMSNSTVVVAATIVSEPDAIMKDLGTVEYSINIQITELLHGAKPKQDKILVQMKRFELGKDDEIPFLRKNARCIFFLTSGEYFSVADMWFGIQPFNSLMASRIKELSSGRKNQ